MPRRSPRTFTNEQLLSAQVHTYAPDTPITEEEAAVLMATTREGMRTRRRDGHPPPFTQKKPRADVRYLLGDVLEARQLHKRTSTHEVHAAHQREMVSSLSFADFLQQAGPDDEWGFVRCGPLRRPVNFFDALRLPLDERHGVAWLTMAEFLKELSEAVEALPWSEEAERRRASLANKTSDKTKERVRS
jgi:hypothetical protein